MVSTYRRHRVLASLSIDEQFPLFFLLQPKKDNQFSAIMGESDDMQMLTRCREEGPRLLAVLKEMKDGLDAVRSKVEALTLKVKQNQLPTENGISYLEAKHLLLLSYCQCAVYYLLRKAKGLSIEGHPVARSLVEIRLFLEKIRPIDKKLEYQVQKFTRAAETTGAEKKMSVDMKKKDDSRGEEDPLKYRPNPDMLVSKSTVATQDNGGVYRPPRFAPTIMDEDKTTKQEKQDLRKDKALLRQAKRQYAMLKRLWMTSKRGLKRCVREIIGAESRELTRYRAKREKQERQEEELFIRAPVTKLDKKIEKHMTKSRNGLLGLADGFFDEIGMIPQEDKENDDITSFRSSDRRKKHKKRKEIPPDGVIQPSIKCMTGLNR
ncbi:Neuroguidin [Ananas comosus]|uniref:Neuroguidin n=1 Tax=Ananas comosus TaxID=4615 RepID=A0A199UL78_ANACO|nr:Neuroguidin [Ananas comosus]